ncbi:baseplate hub protein [Acetobacter sp. LMG 32666]|uniref:baseplate hub protein n=1 Tax=Acetobacter sp. LMG 32666 TaxID=2959295 RepID=UPI0030C7EE0C
MSETSRATVDVVGKRTSGKLHRRKLDVNFNLVTGGFGPGGKDNLTLSGHRVRAHITNAGMATGSSLSLRIEGMTLSEMNRMSVIRARQTWQNANRITLYGGDEKTPMTTIFSGYVTAAFADFTGAPNVAFQVEANNLCLAAAKIIPTISFSSAVSLVTVASVVADAMGWTLVNHGVHTVFPSFYGWGDARSILERLALAAKVVFHVNEDLESLHIWPSDSVDISAEKDMPDISAQNGLIGYPAYSDAGVLFECLFNPNIRYNSPLRLKSNYAPAGWVNNQNGQVPAQTSPANGIWTPYIIEHNLESEVPDGQWTTFVGATRGDNPANFKLG